MTPVMSHYDYIAACCLAVTTLYEFDLEKRNPRRLRAFGPPPG